MNTHPSRLPATPRLLGYLALGLLLLLPISVLVVRWGAWQQGLLLYALACLAAALLLLVLLLLPALPRYRAHWRGILARSLLVLPGTLLLLSLVATRGDYPPIHDISTDLDDPPLFTHADQLRGPDSNPLDIKPDSLERQAQAYPDLDTLHTPLPPDRAWQRAESLAEQLGWKLVYRDTDSGVLEAVATTAIMGFQDDVVIRIRPTANGSAVDLRSVSRVGVGDLGANAARIRAFMEAFREQE